MSFNNKFKSFLSFLCIAILLFSTVTLTGCDSDTPTENTTSAVEITTEITGSVESNISQTENSEESESQEDTEKQKESEKVTKVQSVGDGNSKVVLSKIPDYSGSPYTVINGNVPSFNKSELTTKGYETYSPLDSLGRCGSAVASCGKEIMPSANEERGSISSVKPSGWVQAKYDCVSGKYLYNRCHLIGWQLSAENANSRNLITGTRYMNTEGMLPFENMVADYIRETGNHVAYRVTPVYEGSNLVASGVQIEAFSVEDNGEGICFNVYCYNVQPDIKIDYSTGESRYTGGTAQTTKKPSTTVAQTTKKSVETTKKQNTVTDQYVLNTNTKKIHKTSCRYVNQMSEKNKQNYSGSLDELYSMGYTTCGVCF
ncbi:MAG: DNA/RNA non-specific endonuclease [Acutalibacteraceae bacterium]